MKRPTLRRAWKCVWKHMANEWRLKSRIRELESAMSKCTCTRNSRFIDGGCKKCDPSSRDQTLEEVLVVLRSMTPAGSNINEKNANGDIPYKTTIWLEDAIDAIRRLRSN